MKTIIGHFLNVVIALLCLSVAVPAVADDFTLTSPSLEDNGKLAVKNAGNDKSNPNCVGENVSPPLEWKNPPAGTKSFALTLVDPEGRGGLGVVHWVAYGIPVSVTGWRRAKRVNPPTNSSAAKALAISTFTPGRAPRPGTGTTIRLRSSPPIWSRRHCSPA